MPEQIQVNQSAKPDLGGQALRYGIVALAAGGASWLLHDAIVTGAVVAFATAAVAALPGVGAYLWGAWTTVFHHKREKAMAEKLPDRIATVVDGK